MASSQVFHGISSVVMDSRFTPGSGRTFSPVGIGPGPGSVKVPPTVRVRRVESLAGVWSCANAAEGTPFESFLSANVPENFSEVEVDPLRKKFFNPGECLSWNLIKDHRCVVFGRTFVYCSQGRVCVIRSQRQLEEVLQEQSCNGRKLDNIQVFVQKRKIRVS